MAGPGFINDQPWFKGGVPVFGGGHGCDGGLTCEQLAAYEGPILLDTTETMIEPVGLFPCEGITSCGIVGIFELQFAFSYLDCSGLGGGVGKAWKSEFIEYSYSVGTTTFYVRQMWEASICFVCPDSMDLVVSLRSAQQTTPFGPEFEPTGSGGDWGAESGQILDGSVLSAFGRLVAPGQVICCKQTNYPTPTQVHVIFTLP